MQENLTILFGSQTTGRTRVDSDFDVAVLAAAPLSLQDKERFGARAAKQLGVSEDNIDIVDLSAASPLLQHEVAENGRVLTGTQDEFDAFRLLAWKRYQDTAKFRRARERALALS